MSSVGFIINAWYVLACIGIIASSLVVQRYSHERKREGK